MKSERRSESNKPAVLNEGRREIASSHKEKI